MSSEPCYGENLRFLQMGHGHSHPPLVSILIQPEGRMQQQRDQRKRRRQSGLQSF